MEKIGFEKGSIAIANESLPEEWKERWPLWLRKHSLREDYQSFPAIKLKQFFVQTANTEIETFFRFFHVPEMAAMELVKLRDYQREARDSFLNKDCPAGLISLPTGSGKTLVALSILKEKKCACLILVPTLVLLSQWKSIFFKQGIEAGELSGNTRDLKPVTLSTYDSAVLHVERLGAYWPMLIFDECHHLSSESAQLFCEKSAAIYRLGLSATPFREPRFKPVLERLVGTLLYEKSIHDLGEQVLSPYEHKLFRIRLTSEERLRYKENEEKYKQLLKAEGLDRERDWSKVLKASGKKARVRQAILIKRENHELLLAAEKKREKLLEILSWHPDEKILIFNREVKRVYELSRDLLLPAITFQTRKAEREAIVQGLREGRFRVLLTSEVLNEGVDLPEVSVGIILSGTASVLRHVQRLGRLLRPKPGKRAVLYELTLSASRETKTSHRRRQHPAFEKKR